METEAVREVRLAGAVSRKSASSWVSAFPTAEPGGPLEAIALRVARKIWIARAMLSLLCVRVRMRKGGGQDASRLTLNGSGPDPGPAIHRRLRVLLVGRVSLHPKTLFIGCRTAARLLIYALAHFLPFIGCAGGLDRALRSHVGAGAPHFQEKWRTICVEAVTRLKELVVHNDDGGPCPR